MSLRDFVIRLSEKLPRLKTKLRLSGLVVIAGLVIVLIGAPAQAQKRAWNWVFGNRASLNFASNPPFPPLLPLGVVNAMVSSEGCASMSDSNGNLLFYTNGVVIRDRNGLIMPNSPNFGGADSATQAALIVPYPGKDCKQFFVFFVDHVEIPEQPTPHRLRYLIVDITQNSGFGDVQIGSLNLLQNDVSEKLTAIANNTGFVVLAHGYVPVDTSTFLTISQTKNNPANRRFYAYSVTAATGVTALAPSNTGEYHEPPIIGGIPQGTAAAPSTGQMKISPDGTMIACAIRSRGVEILSFNRNTGAVGPPLATFTGPNLPFDPDALVYGLEFSPDSRKLYVSSLGQPPHELFQYDLNTNIWTPLNSTTLIASSDFGQLQLGPDGKIYMARDLQNFIDVINFPNSPAQQGVPGQGCGYAPLGQMVIPTPPPPLAKSQVGLPNMIVGDYSCDGMIPPEGCCDQMTASPYACDDLTMKYTTFEIYNLKSPSSPICNIDIALNPLPPVGTWQGGGLYINGGNGLAPTQPGIMFVAPYKRIPTIAQGSIAAVSNNPGIGAVKFNIGIDFSLTYTGTVTFVVHHCDGSTCTLTSGPWTVGPPPVNPDLPVGFRVTASDSQSELLPVILTFQARKKSDKSARWMSVQLRNPDAEIFAVESPALNEPRSADPRSVRRKPTINLKSSSKSGRSALFEFSTPLNIGATEYTGATLNLVVKKGAGRDFRPDLLLTLYDDNGNVIMSGPPQR